MLKRLIFAVFVLGLILTLSGTAISDIGKNQIPAATPIKPRHLRQTIFHRENQENSVCRDENHCVRLARQFYNERHSAAKVPGRGRWAGNISS